MLFYSLEKILLLASTGRTWATLCLVLASARSLGIFGYIVSHHLHLFRKFHYGYSIAVFTSKVKDYFTLVKVNVVSLNSVEAS
jgi:hypothetical protein